MKIHFKNKLSVFIFVISITILITSCERDYIEYPPVDTTVVISFSDEIIPVFTDLCIACHSGGIPPDLTEDNAYNSIVTDNLVDTLLPENSIIYTKPLDSHGEVYSALEADLILRWIRQGAKNN